MGFDKKKSERYWKLMPLVGVGLFVFFYVLGAISYTGGSNFNAYETGFSMKTNYLCDLLDTHTPNGLPNPARVYSRLALLILCSSLILLWYESPALFRKKGIGSSVTQTTGIASMVLTLFLASGNHDSIVRIAGVFGVIAVAITSLELLKTRYYSLSGLGLWCLAILFLNYYIYETGTLITQLPTIQKITFSSFLIWFSLLNLVIYKALKIKSKSNP